MGESPSAVFLSSTNYYEDGESSKGGFSRGTIKLSVAKVANGSFLVSCSAVTSGTVVLLGFNARNLVSAIARDIFFLFITPNIII